MKKFADAFYKSGLEMEFFETLINDMSMPEKLRRQIWTLCTTGDRRDAILVRVANEFADSTDELNLAYRWQEIVDAEWPLLRECPLKAEIDGRSKEVRL